ncbi:hypothetical protein BC936DRAFT_139342 [Jimgerdemannia flammicorona]|uniref:Uncharacterized protein n=1 Tax=Jimgerdemannia flammicorona TaxID=994334 RepID=A0A433BA30_9FUNG|nr:hypothetical protein BC936DRAFT_139342 [Jimgerdemannia flammicorona]
MIVGKEITIKVETHIRDYIMLPHKDLKASFVNEIPHVKVGQAAEGGVDVCSWVTNYILFRS